MVAFQDVFPQLAAACKRPSAAR